MKKRNYQNKCSKCNSFKRQEHTGLWYNVVDLTLYTTQEDAKIILNCEIGHNPQQPSMNWVDKKKCPCLEKFFKERSNGYL